MIGGLIWMFFAAAAIASSLLVALSKNILHCAFGLLAALVSGPGDDDAVSAIPPGTAVHEVFWVADTGTLYIDFNRGITTGDGSTGEYYTITTIIRTIGANFPQAEMVQFLVEGYPVETLSGHYGVNNPLDIRKWR